MSTATDRSTAGGRGHLTLLPGLRRLWRDEHAIQLGVDPARAVVVELADPRTARVLDLLDGSRTEPAVIRDAAALGIPRDVAAALITVLRGANVVVPADTLLPPSLPEPARRQLANEAAAIAMRQRTVDVLAPVHRAGIHDQAGSHRPISRRADGAEPTRGPGHPAADGEPTHATTGHADEAEPAPGTGHHTDEAGSVHASGGHTDGHERTRTGDHAGEARPTRETNGHTDGTALARQTGDHPAGNPSSQRPAGREGSRRPPTAAEILRRRAAASIQVTGSSRLVVPICSALATAGVGHVDPAVVGRVRPGDNAVGGLLPADTDRPRGTAATDAVMRAAPHVDTRALRDGTATFVVQVGQGVPAELAAYGYARRALPHLLIEERDDTILVGPLVTPAGSPCLRCLDLHRRDRDPAWPLLVAQLATTGEDSATASTATTMIAVGVAVGQVLGYLDGVDIVTIGASIEVGPPFHLRRRSWAAHPRCDCASRPRPRNRSRSG